MSEVIVIGGGVVGSATAYHLAAMGCDNVSLLERTSLGSGTTWHAAGNMETYREDPLLGAMIAYAVELYPRLELETGQALGWRQSGRVTFTKDPRRFEQYKGLPSVGEARGIEIELLSPQGVGDKLPIINTEGLAGGIWVPSDGRINPTDLAVALAKGARQKGVDVRENLPVVSITTDKGKITGVTTEDGHMACDTVVIACGLWSADLGRTCGVALPLHAVEHFYFLTEAQDCIGRDLPLFLSYDELMYGREDVGGLLFGFLDRNAVPISPRQLPGDFSFGLLAENWPQAEPYLETALHRFPFLHDAGIRSLINGPESFTPDGNMLLGPVPRVAGLFVAAAMNSNGIALSAGAGKLTAEWILDGRPSLDASRLEVSRFAALQGTERFMRERVTEVPSFFGLWPEPGLDYKTSRNVRCAPLHSWHAKRGAVFVSQFAWEQPAWYDAGCDSAQCVSDELNSMSRCAWYDASADTKFLVYGTDTASVLEQLGLAEGAAVGSVLIRNEFGGVEADPLCVSLSQTDALLIAAPELETRFGDYIHNQLSDRLQVTAVSSSWCRFELFGEQIGELLGKWGIDLGLLEVERLHAVSVGYVTAYCLFDPRLEVWTLLAPSEMSVVLAETINDSGFAAKPVGAMARERWRIIGGHPRWGAEVTPGTHHDQNTTLFRFELASAQSPASLTPVWAGRRAVGHVTSSAQDLNGQVILFALIDSAHQGDGLTINVDGQWLALQSL